MLAYSLRPAIVMTSVNRFGSVSSFASWCHDENNCIGFSGGFVMCDKFDVSIIKRCQFTTKVNIYISLVEYSFLMITTL